MIGDTGGHVRTPKTDVRAVCRPKQSPSVKGEKDMTRDLSDSEKKMVSTVLENIEKGQAADESTIEHVEDNFWRKFRKVVGRIPFAKDVLALYYCMEDPATPLAVKLSIAAALAYFISPIDAIPDVLPGIGYLDDGSVIAGVIALIDAHIQPEHRRKAEEFFSG